MASLLTMKLMCVRVFSFRCAGGAAFVVIFVVVFIGLVFMRL